MDFTTFVSDYLPAIIGVVGIVAAAAWATLKAIAPLTKTTADDEFVAEHGDEVESILDKLEK